MKFWAHFLHYFWFGVMLFAAGTPTITDPGAGAATGAGEGSPSGEGSAPGAGAGAGEQQGVRQLREAYEGLKTKHEPWEKLGATPDVVGGWRGTYDKVFTEVAAIGRELGYSDDEIVEALREDPVRTLDYLRDEAARAEQSGQGKEDQGEDLRELVAQHVEQAIGPIQQRENVRITNEANALFERTVHGLAVEAFKAEGVDVANIPEDEMFMLTSAVSEIIKYDEGAIRSLKYEGKTGAIQKAFQEARTYLDKYYIARSGRERSKLTRDPGNSGHQSAREGEGKKPTLDEMINEPGLINKKYGH